VLQRAEYTEPMKLLLAAVDEQQSLAIEFERDEATALADWERACKGEAH
jgi:hypothetical protein